jgi:hypothetical protein
VVVWEPVRASGAVTASAMEPLIWKEWARTEWAKVMEMMPGLEGLKG